MSKRAWFGASLAALALIAACDDDDDDITGPVARYGATLNGQNEVPPRTTTATGTADIRLEDQNTLSWTVSLNGITNLTAAHIHRTPSDLGNGPIVLFLTDPNVPPTNQSTIAGSVTRSTCVDPVCVGATFDEIVALLNTTNGAYVNVHTDDGVSPANTGQGDFPGGEIRGFVTAVP